TSRNPWRDSSSSSHSHQTALSRDTIENSGGAPRETGHESQASRKVYYESSAAYPEDRGKRIDAAVANGGNLGNKRARSRSPRAASGHGGSEHKRQKKAKHKSTPSVMTSPSAGTAQRERRLDSAGRTITSRSDASPTHVAMHQPGTDGGGWLHDTTHQSHNIGTPGTSTSAPEMRQESAASTSSSAANFPQRAGVADAGRLTRPSTGQIPRMIPPPLSLERGGMSTQTVQGPRSMHEVPAPHYTAEASTRRESGNGSYSPASGREDDKGATSEDDSEQCHLRGYDFAISGCADDGT
ncbi:uncharacterized protein TRAVEDRAFT_25111, partial [Trametes versicolor FP-101664 SS1]